MLQGFDKFFPRTEDNEERIVAIRQEAEKMIGEPIEALPYSYYRIYYETGSRVEYEQLYMKHRRRLWHFLAMSMWEDDPVWIREVSDSVSAICGEPLWAFPAHVKADASYIEMHDRIDLFAAETAHALSETAHLLGDRLPKTIRELIEYNVNERIVKPYLKAYYDYGPANWSAVCHGCVAMCFIELGFDEAFSEGKEYIVKGLNRFLESFADDGICQEGPLYWSYGFGHFTYAAAMIREYTGGEIDLFKVDKMKNIAAFYENAFVKPPYTVPFADAGHLLYLNPGLVSFLAREFGTARILKGAAMKYGCDTRWRFGDMVRNFFWSDGFAEDTTDLGMRYFENAQWYVKKTTEYAIAAKGGHNDEPHNHNDVGSIVVYDGSTYVVDDLGWPEYDATYFNKAYRYKKYICASSLGHSVPIVNGEAQLYGKEHCASVIEASDNVFKLDLSRAYGLDDGSIIRTIASDDNSVTITDATNATNSHVSRIALRVEPAIADGKVSVGRATIEPLKPCTISVSQEEFETRYSVAVSDTGRYVMAYLVDFKPLGDAKETVLKVKIK